MNAVGKTLSNLVEWLSAAVVVLVAVFVVAGAARLAWLDARTAPILIVACLLAAGVITITVRSLRELRIAGTLEPAKATKRITAAHG